jgi:hypothetical protein
VPVQHELLDETKLCMPIGGIEMRLIPRHRNHRSKTPRVSITQAEITADLLYPAAARSQRDSAVAARRGGGR